MNFGEILEDVSRGNFSSCVELNNFKQVDKEHIREILSKDIRSTKEKYDWISHIEEEGWKPEVVSLIKDVYPDDASNKRTKVRDPAYLRKTSERIALMKKAQMYDESDEYDPFISHNDVLENLQPVVTPMQTFGLAPEFKTIPPLFRGTADSAGHDLPSLVEVTVPAHGFVSVETGVHIDIPSGYHVDVRPRSGLGFRNQVVAFNGVIDSDYSSVNPDDPRCANTIKVGMFNFSDKDYTIQAGERIAQLIISQNHHFNNSVVGDAKSHNGFGSTGK
jgi:dUTP pyrophosphatase